jgi:hypothetical protein
MSGNKHEFVQRITQCTFYQNSLGLPVSFNILNNQCDHAVSINRYVQCSANAVLLSKAQDSIPLEFGCSGLFILLNGLA